MRNFQFIIISFYSGIAEFYIIRTGIRVYVLVEIDKIY